LAALHERPDALVEACRTLAIDRLFMPAVPPDQRDMAAQGWRALGLELGTLCERFREQGIALGYHNHDWELTTKEGGKTALELIFEAAGNSPLTWQADVAWLVRGGAEPKAWLQRYRDRLTSAHVKDLAAAGQNLDQDGWADVGAGTLDWPDLWQACRAAGARWMVVEHDKPADPVRTARASFAYLSAMGD
jgi:sugar phosphate isomerase/epimerase